MTDAIDELSQVLSDPAEVLSDPAAMLFGLEAEFTVLRVERTGPAAVKVIIEQAAREGPCPALRGAVGGGEGAAAGPGQGPPGVRAAGRAVVAETPPVVPRIVVSAAVVHPDL